METSYRFEPCFPETFGSEILDLVAAIARKSAALDEKLDPRTACSLADLVRVMSSFYSNLIEGHNTLPREIEAALENEFSQETDLRNRQFEARNHVRLQEAVDRKFADGTLPEPASPSFLNWLHAEFYDDMPADFRIVRSTTRTLDIVPGRMRRSPEEEVPVGRHIPPSPQYVAEFMHRFAERYAFAKMGDGEKIIAIASAHHRFNYIHPFVDGNGRVSRLMSHAMTLQAGIGAHGLWSVSRGLARGLDSRKEYKAMMEHADAPRQGDLDGRGNLSERALKDFIAWFLKIMVDQLDFMTKLYDLPALAGRLHRLAEIEWRPEAGPLLEYVLRRGEVPRGEASHVTGLGVRSTSDLVQRLVKDGILQSETPKSPLFLRFKADFSDVLFPRLFPET
ncbi:MAG TPA: Fic family protein [Rhizomicrobium sp.]